MVDRGLFNDQQGIAPYRRPIRDGSRVLPKGFVPGEWDVICHSSKDTHDHIGNRRFDLCVENNIEAYKKAKSRVAKSAVISDIVGSIRESSTTGGGFVRYDIGIERWYEVGDKVARDKVGQSLRVHNSKRKKSREKETYRPFHNPLLGSSNEAPRSDLEASPISSFVSTRTEQDQPARPTDSTVSVLPKPPGNITTSQQIDDMMLLQKIHMEQGGKLKCNDGSDDSPGDDSLIAWFEADARGIK